MALAQPKFYTEEDYNNLPENVRAELIDGQIYYQAAPSRIHQEILSNLHAAIHHYIKSNGGSCKVYPAPFAVKLRENSETIVKPDISVICDSSKLTDKGCSGAPDWIIEITSPSNSSHDYIKKLNLYYDAGVHEYWIVNPMNETIYVYDFRKEQVEANSYSFSDQIKVNIYDHFTIDFKEIAL